MNKSMNKSMTNSTNNNTTKRTTIRKIFNQTTLNLALISALAALTVKTQWLEADSTTVRELNVQRINVMEPSGQPRLVLAKPSKKAKSFLTRAHGRG